MRPIFRKENRTGKRHAKPFILDITSVTQKKKNFEVETKVKKRRLFLLVEKNFSSVDTALQTRDYIRSETFILHLHLYHMKRKAVFARLQIRKRF